MSRSVIVSGARTPMGRLLGSLKDFSAADLGGVAIKAALERAGISGDQVDYVIMGQVLQAGAGQNPARPAAVAGGIPMSVPSFTLNKVCLSGLDAIALADQLIRAGEFEIVVAGGMESMTQAPHLLANSRTGTKYGDTKLVDSMAHDGLSDTFDQVAMGVLTEQANSRYDLTREEQDAFAAASATRRPPPPRRTACSTTRSPRCSSRSARATRSSSRDDEGIRADTTADSLSKLKPAFAKDGTITAGTASQISDGACAVVVMSAEKAAELGLHPARRDRRARRRRRAGRHPADASRRGRSRRPARARASTPRTSTWSSSTRPSPPSASSPPASWASTRRRSTSTAAPSRWATRSA